MNIIRFLSLVLPACTACGKPHGFDPSPALVASEEILSGGPSRDGIPALLKPRFVPANRATFLAGNDLVVGVVLGDQARAYPIRILNWHEIVNDTLGGRDIAVAYRSLRAGAMVPERPGRTFGVSGLVYRGSLLRCEHQSGSSCSQLGMKAVTGRAAGARLAWLPPVQTTWRVWRRRHPGIRLLSPNTGFDRDDEHDPCTDCQRDERVVFPVPMYNRSLPAKARVAGLFFRGRPVAFPVERLLAEWSDGAPRLRSDAAASSLIATGERSEQVPVAQTSWFARQALYPATTLHETP